MESDKEALPSSRPKRYQVRTGRPEHRGRKDSFQLGREGKLEARKQAEEANMEKMVEENADSNELPGEEDGA
ncbi:hypothetical protein AXF42_Ash012401 [Apostasia shenzhenica]|uniref:Uncharacterized protein n=1 Tax=Apostasia shenzhenica TaxID=1088818 RepID=A0A2I0AQN6_9ASPA|nr:hypothetical protein AXF42_Ash012401 [Apostasia shenzhenica]